MHTTVCHWNYQIPDVKSVLLMASSFKYQVSVYSGS